MFCQTAGHLIGYGIGLFYHSEVYQLIRDGVSDMHCMSDAYLAEELKQEYCENKANNAISGVDGVNTDGKRFENKKEVDRG